MADAAAAFAAELLRVIAGYDQRTYDAVQVEAHATIIRRYPQFDRRDWYTGIEDWYARPGAMRIKPGDIASVAQSAFRRRTGADQIPQLTGGLSRSGMPADFWQMAEEARQVSAEIRATGVIPTADLVGRETARRRRERSARQDSRDFKGPDEPQSIRHDSRPF